MSDQKLPSISRPLNNTNKKSSSMKFAYWIVITFLIFSAYILFNPPDYPSTTTLLQSLSYFGNSVNNHNNGSHFPNSALPPSNSGNLSSFSYNTTNDTTQNGNISSPPQVAISNHTLHSNDSSSMHGGKGKNGGGKFDESMLNCNIYVGKWVKDDSYPLYQGGSCPHIDEPFNCFLNHRPENAYEKYRWQPHGCNIPRLNATNMLEMLRGKRFVLVGDSLNRNMWESLVCVLRHAVKDKNKVYEVSGRQEFRTEGSYSFIFEDYNCSVEFFRSPFLVQEWEVPDKNGSTKETLRLDLLERQCDKYKDADVLIFNTGHWWSHDKLLRGQSYYQEGSHVYGELDVNEAYRRAVTTWARWVEDNVDHKKTQVFFRGYSASHFGGGKWNSGGRCDKETEPFQSEAFLESYPFMDILEDVLKWMKIPVFYLNITTLTDYRKDAHPSIYRAPHLTEEEMQTRYQDCAHWCLPGVPDTWNELVYSQMLVRHHQRLQEARKET